jgi:hypothetical protein
VLLALLLLLLLQDDAADRQYRGSTLAGVL